MSTTLIDGLPGQSIDSADRGFQYGDGLFETIRCCEGRARWLRWHFERLQRGCTRLRLEFNEFDALAREIEQLVAGQERCLVKVIVTRGVAKRRGYRPAGNERSTRIVSRYAWPETSNSNAPAFRLGVSTVKLGTNPLLAGLKHLNRLEQVMAQLALPAEELDEVLMLSSAGWVIGGSMSNVFFADESGLFTPELTECGVAGVMRRLVIESAQRLGVIVREERVTPARLGAVRSAFVTNVRWGLQPVAMLEGRVLEDDDYAQRLWSLIETEF